jgi:hypothetical protein
LTVLPIGSSGCTPRTGGEAYWRRIYAEKHPEPVPFLVNGASAKLAE